MVAHNSIPKNSNFPARKFLLLLGVLFALFLLVFLYKINEVVLSVSLNSSITTGVQVYHDRGNGIKRGRFRTARILSDQQNTIRFRLPPETKKIRLDPATTPSEITVHHLKIYRGAISDSGLSLEMCLVAKNQIQFQARRDNLLLISATGTDPQLLIPAKCVPPMDLSAMKLVAGFCGAGLLALILTLVTFWAWQYRNRLIPAVLYAAIGIMLFQVLLVAMFSEFNLHPDENSHFKASAYFQSHWFKQAVDHPAMLKTLIPGWGSSYLYLNDIVYSLAEKTTSVLEYFGFEDKLRYRLFNFALLPILLVVFIADRRHGIWFLLAVGLTSQTWYLFSYFNGDALGMFGCLLLGNFFIRHRDEIGRNFWKVPEVSTVSVAFYALCILILFSRLHYAIFVAFLFGLVLIRQSSGLGLRDFIIPSSKLALLVLLLTLPLAMAEMKDQIVNGFDKGSAVAAVQEEYKRPEFKREYILETGNNPHNLYLKETGLPYFSMLSDYRWLQRSYVSFFGVYGFLNIRAPVDFYFLISIVGALTTVFYLIFASIRSRPETRSTVAWFCLMAILVVIQSSLYSWTHGVQAQGRYLLAIIPMLAVTFALVEHDRDGPRLGTQSYILLLFLVNTIGFGIYGVIPMLNL